MAWVRPTYCQVDSKVEHQWNYDNPEENAFDHNASKTSDLSSGMYMI